MGLIRFGHMSKRFLEWLGIKQKLHEKATSPIFFSEGDIWWCGIGENIGVEVNGKGETFSRPVFVYKKLSRDSFMGIPLTTQVRQGTWYVGVGFKGRSICANLAQARVFSASRMYQKHGMLNTRDCIKIKSGFLRLYS